MEKPSFAKRVLEKKTEIEAKIISLISTHNSDNTAHSTLFGNKSKVSFTRSLSTGTEIGSITIDGVTTKLYCETDTNTTYNLVNSNTNGLMSSADKNKLDGIADGADSIAFSRSLSSGTKIGTITINNTSTDIYCETNTDTVYTVATTSANGLMSSSDKTKLDGITASADSVSFNRILSSGTKIGTITINGVDTDLYCETDTDTVYSVATTSADGLMSSSDKAKLDGITASADAVSFNQTLSTGTKIGTITINGTDTDLYCEPDTNTSYSAVTQSTNGLMTKEDKQKLDKSMAISAGNAGGTTSAYTATLTGVTLTHGTVIALYNAVGNNAANATLNVNNLGAKPIYYQAETIAANRYPNKVTGIFMYNTSIVSTGCWQMIFSYNENSFYYLTSSNTITAGEALAGTRLIACKKADGKYYQISTLAGTVINTSEPILITNAAFTQDQKNSATNLHHPWVEFKNSYSGITADAYKTVYLEGTAYANNQLTLSSTPLTATLTNGRYYIRIGTTYNNTPDGGVDLTNQKVMYYDGTNLKPVEEYKFSPSSHTHGNITNAGAIGSTANLPIITDTNGVLKAGSFGTAANTFCQGNDSRLDIKNNLTSTDTNKPLSAAQGRELKTQIDNITTGNVDLSSTHTHKNLEKTEIKSGGDLNNYTNNGWYSYSSGNSANIANVPEQIGSVMEVIDDYSDGNYVVQTVYTLPSNKDSKIYFRQKYSSNGWGSWVRIDGKNKANSTHTHHDTDIDWNGTALAGEVSPVDMAMYEEFNPNRLAFFNGNNITVEYSTDGGSSWTAIGTVDTKRQLVTTSSSFTLGNNSKTDYSKNQLRITIKMGEQSANSILYMATRKLMIYLCTCGANSPKVQLSYSTYKTPTTFTNIGSAYTVAGWSGWNSIPLNVTLGGYDSQTGSDSTRIQNLRLTFTQTGGTANMTIYKLRLFGETQWRAPSTLAQTGHLYSYDDNQNATFPAKIIKSGGTSSQFLKADGSVDSTTYVATGDSRLTNTRTPTDGTVTTAKIADSAVTSAKIADGTIVNEDIANTTIQGGKLVNGTITATQLASNAVEEAKIKDANVTTAKIANDAITIDKVKFTNNIGGTNLLLGTQQFSSGTNGSLTGEFYKGAAIKRYNNTSGTTYMDCQWNGMPVNGEFKQGDRFTLSFWAKGTGGIICYCYGSGSYLGCKPIKSSGGGQTTGYGDGSCSFTLTSDWKRYYVTWECYPSAADSTLTAEKKLLIRTNKGTDSYIAGPMFERGEIAHDWNISPLENNNNKIVAGNGNTKDLNNYTTPGFYYNDNNTSCGYISNLAESGKAFWLLVEGWGASNYTKQTITHYSSNDTYTRIRNAGTWGSWKKISADTDTTYSASTGLTLSGTAFSVNYGTAAGTACQGNDSRLSDVRTPKFNLITASSSNIQDLNNYKTGGFYYTNSDANYAPYIIHCPNSNGTSTPYTGNKSFFLLVETWGTTSTYVKQTLTYYTDNNTYTRTCSNGTWGNWKRFDTNNNNSYLYGGVQINANTSTDLPTQTFVGGGTDGKYIKLEKGKVLDVRYPIVYTNGAITKSTSSNNVYHVHRDAKTSNNVSSNWTTGNMIYLEGSAFSNGQFTINNVDAFITPTLQSGKFYIRMGEACSTTQVRFTGDMTVYYYNGTNLIPSVSWNAIVNKPSTYAPSSHTHASSDVTGLTASLNVVTDANGKLSTEAKNNHTHNYLPTNANGTTTGTLTATKFINSSSNNTNILLGNGNTLAQSTFATSGHNHDGTYLKSYTPPTASTSQAGIVQLNDAINNSSTTQAATANAVNKTYTEFSNSSKTTKNGHTHTKSQITDFPTSMTPTAHSHNTWTSVKSQDISGIGAVNLKVNTDLKMCSLWISFYLSSWAATTYNTSTDTTLWKTTLKNWIPEAYRPPALTPIPTNFPAGVFIVEDKTNGGHIGARFTTAGGGNITGHGYWEY